MKANNLKTEISWSYSIKRGFIEDETFVAKALFTPIDFEIIDLTKDEIITKIEEKVSSLGAKKLIGLLFNPSFCEENALDDEHCHDLINLLVSPLEPRAGHEASVQRILKASELSQVMAPYLLYYSFYYPEVSSQVIPLVNLEPSNAVSVKTISTIGKLPDNVEKEIGVTLLKTISEVEALDYRVQKAVLSSVLRLVSLHIEGSADLASKYFKSLQPAAIQENDTSMIDLLDELLPFASEVLKSELTELYAPLKKKSPADLMASLFDDD
jgi:hypothetical protein